MGAGVLCYKWLEPEALEKLLAQLSTAGLSGASSSQRLSMLPTYEEAFNAASEIHHQMNASKSQMQSLQNSERQQVPALHAAMTKGEAIESAQKRPVKVAAGEALMTGECDDVPEGLQSEYASKHGCLEPSSLNILT